MRAARRQLTKSEMIQRKLDYGPMTSADGAMITGLPLRYVSAVLHKLWKRGKIARSERMIRREFGPGAYVYARKSKRVRVWTTAELTRLKGMDGMTARQAATALGRPLRSVYHQAARYGVKFRSGL